MNHYIDRFPDREILVEDKKFLYFGGTAYLGLQTAPEFQALLISNIVKYGTNYGASRNSNVRLSIFGQAESYLTEMVGSSSCMTMSSGYLAAQLVVQKFSNPIHKLFYAPHAHSALFSTKHKSYTSFETLNTAIRRHLEIKKSPVPVVLLDSIDFSGGNYPDFNGLRSLPLDKIILVVDDSHGIGILGANGGGVFSLLKKMEPKELIVCCSLGKGLGIQAGAIFGEKPRIEALSNSELYGGASPASPASLATLMQAAHLCKKRRNRLQNNLSIFLNTLRNKKTFVMLKDHPTFSFADNQLAAFLESQNIIITNFNYPSDGNSSMKRIVVSANHMKKDLLNLAECIDQYHTKTGQI